MAVGFTDKERTEIIAALRASAAKHAAQDGLRHTTVDQLAEDAGISKGAFYKFYPSKERLFLDMLEQYYANVSQAAAEALTSAQDLSPKERGAVMFKAAMRTMWKTPLAGFLESDMAVLLRKLPEDVIREHYISDGEFVRHLIEASGIELAQPFSVVYAVVRILFLSQLTAAQAGPDYDRALDVLVDGAASFMIR